MRSSARARLSVTKRTYVRSAGVSRAPPPPRRGSPPPTPRTIRRLRVSPRETAAPAAAKGSFPSFFSRLVFARRTTATSPPAAASTSTIVSDAGA